MFTGFVGKFLRFLILNISFKPGKLPNVLPAIKASSLSINISKPSYCGSIPNSFNNLFK